MGSSHDDLYSAVKKGDLEDIIELLANPAIDINAIRTENRHYGSALSVAAEEGHIDVVKLLLECGADVSTADDYQWTPLHHAVHMNRFEVAKILILNGADVSAKPEETPLMVAAGFVGRKSPCQQEMFQLLIDSGAGVNDKGYKGMTPLHLAARACHTVAVECLLANGANTISMRDDDILEPIHHACSNYDTARHRSWAHPGPTPETGGYSWGVTEYDNKDDTTPIIKLLLANGADVNAVGRGHATPLFLAIWSRDERRVRLLLDMGANLTSRLGSFHPLCVRACDRNHCHVDCTSGRKLGKSILEAASDQQVILKMIQNESARRFTISFRMALTMGLHERLGMDSMLAIVDQELLREIVDSVHPLDN
jgi:ankyrin repeat protein